ncbi:MAG: DUF115 domain-containing protein [Treponema sp.]|nr:DUF115 domain-containing protein [Treponema sp.]
MNYWQINLSKVPGLEKRLCTIKEDWLGEADIVVETTVSGEATMRVRGVYVHSPRDPLREGRRLVESVGKQADGDSARHVGGDSARHGDEGPIIVLGFGLGYAAEAAARTGRSIIVVERHAAILKKALETRDLSMLLTRDKFSITLGGASDGVLIPLRYAESAEPSVIRNRALTQLDEQWYAEVERYIQIWKDKEAVNQATLRRFGIRWVRNFARNMTTIRDFAGIHGLAGVLRGSGLPVLLIAAGPSLDAVLPLLPDLAKRCVIVAVDTALRRVLETGVEPDFAVALDPQYWNYRHLDRAPALRTCLIADSSVYPAVLRHPFARILLCPSQFPLGRFIEERLDNAAAGQRLRLGAGGSVATTAWDFARILGPASIWIAGLDLSYPGLKTHFKGALFETRALSESTRLNPAATWSLRALMDGLPFTAPAADGGIVRTDRRLSLYAAWFESRLCLNPPTYRLDVEGLAIAGMKNGASETLLALPEQRNTIQRLLETAFASAKHDLGLRSQQYEAACRDLLDGLNHIRAIAKDTAALLETASQRIPPPEYRDALLKKLDIANKAIGQSTVKDIASFLFPPLAEIENGEQSADPFIRHIELSHKLYQALFRAVDTVCQYLTNSALLDYFCSPV